MNIVFLAPFGIRPKGTVIARILPLAASLQERHGHRVTVVLPPYTNPEDSGKTETVRGVKLLNIRLSHCWKPVATLLMAWRMFQVALAERPDIVHLFKPKGYGGLAAMLMIWLTRLGARLPAVMVDTDDWEGAGGMNDLHAYSALERKVFAFQEQWLLSRAVAVTVASRALEQMVRQCAKASGRTMYLPNCVDDSAPGDGSGIRQRFDIAGDAPVVLLYTRFFEFEQQRLHEVFESIFRRVPGVRFLVVGAGRTGEEQQLQAAAVERGFSGALVMAGWVEPGQLRDFLAAGDLALYPFADTLVNRCKCPAKLTELLLVGVPVVADGVGQIPEYLVHDQGGILCRTGDVDAMVEGAVRLIGDRAVRLRMGQFNRNHIREQFDWNRMAAALSKLYENPASVRIDSTGNRAK